MHGKQVHVCKHLSVYARHRRLAGSMAPRDLYLARSAGTSCMGSFAGLGLSVHQRIDGGPFLPILSAAVLYLASWLW